MAYRKVRDEDVARHVIQSKSKEQLARVSKIIEALKKIRRYEKLLSSYVNSTENAINYNQENKVYFDYRLDGTVTGRLSCGAMETREGTMGVSFHTIPRVTKELNLRRCYVAAPGYDFICADYSSMELRCLAIDSKDKDFIKAFWSGKDLHKYTASLIFNKDIEEVTPEERQIAKSVSFLLIYGGGPGKLAKTANISYQDAKNAFDSYFVQFPGVIEWMSKSEQEIKKLKYAENFFGRRELLPNVSSVIKEEREQAIRQGINFKIQSFASDIVCYAAIDIHNEFIKRGMATKLVGLVHDSIEANSPHDETKEACSIIEDKMTNIYTVKKLYPEIDFCVPLKIEIEIGKSFA